MCKLLPTSSIGIDTFRERTIHTLLLEMIAWTDLISRVKAGLFNLTTKPNGGLQLGTMQWILVAFVRRESARFNQSNYFPPKWDQPCIVALSTSNYSHRHPPRGTAREMNHNKWTRKANRRCFSRDYGSGRKKRYFRWIPQITKLKSASESESASTNISQHQPAPIRIT